MGFYYANLTDPHDPGARTRPGSWPSRFRLRPLGVPVCNALPHAFDLFEDEFRKAEGFFAVVASLGGTHLFRTHEVAHVRAVLARDGAWTRDRRRERRQPRCPRTDAWPDSRLRAMVRRWISSVPS